MVQLNFGKEKENFIKGIPVTTEYSHFSELDCPQLEAYLASLLRSISLEFLLEIIFTILNELLVNAFKANAKRVFFENKGIDINDESSYADALREFRDAFGEFRESLIDSLDNSNYRIILKIANEKDKIKFWVTNNAQILTEEKSRIDFRIQSSSKVKNLSEAYQETLDTEESSGLGIVLVQLLLRNSGILENEFRVESEGFLTTAYFEIPKDILPAEAKEKIREVLRNGVEGLPPFPDKVNRLLNIIKDSATTIQKISLEIEKDPGITVEVLKLANSPLFQGQSQVSTAIEAIRRIGLMNLEKILYITGAKRVFPMSYQKVRDIWNHALRTAFYSIEIAKLRQPTQAKKDLVSVSGLLHDLGRMALVTLDKHVIDIINKLRRDRLMNSSEFVEEISLGTSHTEIGQILVEKWNFPKDLAQVIIYHHRPWLADTKYIPECEAVYVADFLANLNRKKTNFAIIDPDVLKKFGLTDMEEIINLEASLDKKFSELPEEEE
ncbi:HDOD domain-containing protein [Leptospira sp. GIMC2001]|uniref:HDOD domain-containing protein n=1 Tax=Leptospira sp. GIMC2001 TaxID=1513297 RepID=UPI00234B0CE5|nr:HDOD domain-containing protein [Leptospira sp. GIMC2001]WCL47713.1 HDOD domain-containing protein [Leptospira sp. GIMC2001]